MKHIFGRWAASVCALGAAILPTAAGEVKTFPAPGIDLTVFKTFKVLPIRVLTRRGLLENDPDISPFILSSLRIQLAAKGMTETAAGADLEVSAGALAVAVPQLEAIIYSWIPSGTQWGSAPLATVGRYNKEGTLVVNLIDPRRNESVWFGLAKRALGKPENLGKDIDKAAQALFRKFPASR